VISAYQRWRQRAFLAPVKPATVVICHRQGWRLLWRMKSRRKRGKLSILL